MLNELLSLRFVTKDLVQDISNNIEAIYRNESLRKTHEWIDLTEMVGVEEKAVVRMAHQMLDKLFGHNFLQNKFFSNLPLASSLQMIQNCTRVHLNQGETVYYEGQVAVNGSIESDSVFLVLTGKVNCLLGRNICFKSYIQGSYFGDFEVLSNQRRLFSVRAEESTTLIVIDKKTLNDVLETHPQSHLHLWEKTLERYLMCKQSLFRVNKFGKISMKEDFWDLHREEDRYLNKVAGDLLENVVMKTPSNIGDRLSRFSHMQISRDALNR